MELIMNNVSAINIFNFIRLSNEEPTRFIEDDFITVKKQIEVLKQLGLPSTFALKYDALTDFHYQNLLKSETDENDEIAVWWEVTKELCEKAGVGFKGKDSDVFDNRVGCGYSIGYNVTERKKLVDAYMKEFKKVFGYYPKTISSWVIDIETLKYAHEKYGACGGAICRDQIATDGFTLMGPYVNGGFYPSLQNEVIPAQTIDNQLDMPIFRLLGPDPIYSYESGIREGITGVYSLEPVAPLGRDKNFFSWMFNRIVDDEQLGLSYLQVGQENNFLWDNIKPGFEPQLSYIKNLATNGKVRIETLKTTAEWFKRKYKVTPPSTFNATVDHDEKNNLKTLWYSSKNYRVSFLYEKGRLTIRDMFLFNENYKSRYLNETITTNESIFDALPVINPHYFSNENERNEIKVLDTKNEEISFETIDFIKNDEFSFKLVLSYGEKQVEFLMCEDKIVVVGDVKLQLNKVPVLKEVNEKELIFSHENFSYNIKIQEGKAIEKANETIFINENKKIVLNLAQKEGEKEILSEEYLKQPERFDQIIPVTFEKPNRVFKPKEPEIEPKDRIFMKGQNVLLNINSDDSSAEIHYTLDKSIPNEKSDVFNKQIELKKNTTVKAVLNKKGCPLSDVSESRIFFAEKVDKIESETVFDKRAIFNKEGVKGLINSFRGTRDYQDSNWLGTVDDLDVVLTLESSKKIDKLTVGFLSNHRCGVIYPKYVSVYIENQKSDNKELLLYKTIEIENKPTKREIETKDIVFNLNGVETKKIRVFAKNYKIGPSWACYKGLPGVFLFTDSIIIE